MGGFAATPVRAFWPLCRGSRGRVGTGGPLPRAEVGGFAALLPSGPTSRLPIMWGIPPPPFCGGAPPPGPPGELFLWRKSSQKAREGRLASLPKPSTRGQPRDPARGDTPLDPQFPEAFLFSGQESIFPVLSKEPARHSSWRSTRRQYSSDMGLHPHTRMDTEPRPSRRELDNRVKREKQKSHVPDPNGTCTCTVLRRIWMIPAD